MAGKNKAAEVLRSLSLLISTGLLSVLKSSISLDENWGSSEAAKTILFAQAKGLVCLIPHTVAMLHVGLEISQNHNSSLDYIDEFPSRKGKLWMVESLAL